MKFTQIPDSLRYPPSVKGRLSTLHSAVITYVSANFQERYKLKEYVLQVMNTLSVMMLTGDALPENWSELQPLKNLELIDDEICKEVLKDIYIYSKDITWDLKSVKHSEIVEFLNLPELTDLASTSSETAPAQDTVSNAVITTAPNSTNVTTTIDVPPAVYTESKMTDPPTPKEDLYIRSPAVPQFDVTKPWRWGYIDNTKYVVYPSLPEIPRKQNEISATTDIRRFTDAELLALYPNRLIHTRAPSMYEEVSGLEYHPDLGVIFPIEGFTSEQIVENIIQYPHIFRLTKCVDGQIVNFYTTLEIDGQLHKTSEIWQDLPESKVIPRTSEFVKEYVVRRYLLERDVKRVEHIYPMFGSLEPFLTLFSTPDHYAQLGYDDAVALAKQCVQSRVSYKQTRNPVLRRLKDV